MPSILIIQSAGQRNGTTHLCKNDYLRECLSLQFGFQQCGWVADVWGLRHPNFFTLPDFDSYDYILTLENYETEWLPDLTKYTKPVKIQWIIDLHCQSVEVYENITRQLDIVLHSTKALMKKYEERFPDKKHIWFPNGFDSRYFVPMDLPKEHKLIFIGNIINQGELLKYMVSNYGLKYFMKTGEDMIKLLNSTKIHFNHSTSVDVNYRNFETLACGICLLTNYLPEMEELGFKDGENCLMYRTLEELDEKIKFALTDSNWKRIGDAGLEFSKKHSYVVRVKDFIENHVLLKNSVKIGSTSIHYDDFITGDRFLKIANENKDKSIQYIKTDPLWLGPRWRGEWRGKPHFIEPGKVWITGHSDYGINDTVFHIYKDLCHVWFATNCTVNNPKIVQIPIGITNDCDDNPVHRIFGNLYIMQEVMSLPRVVRTDKKVYLNFSVNTYAVERKPLMEMFMIKDWVTVGISEPTLSGRRRFLEEIRNHNFVLCPRGNGIDTHRLWETLYMESIPIVRRTPALTQFEDLPISWVDSWEEVTPEWLDREYERITSREWCLDKLKMSYWKTRILSSV
jgi:hypothetical protein